MLYENMSYGGHYVKLNQSNKIKISTCYKSLL